MFSLRPVVILSALFAVVMGPLLSMTAAQEATPVGRSSLAPIIWKTKTDGNLEISDRPAAIGGDRIYIVDPDGTLTARSMATGSVAWEIETEFEGGIIQVSASDDVVAVVRGGEMRVYDDNDDGDELWTRTVANPGDVFPPASFSGDLLITSELEDDQALPHSTGEIFGLTALTGGQEWEYVGAGGLDAYQIPVADGLAFVSLSDGNVEAIDIADGTSEWQGAAFTTGYTAPIVAGDFVLAQGENPSGQPTITAFDRTSGNQSWQVTPSGYLEGVAGTSVITTTAASFAADGSAFAGIQALDIADGTERWVIEDASVTAVASAGDTGFLATSSIDPAGAVTASVVKLDAESGAIEWTLALESPSFSLTPCGDKLFVRHGAFVASTSQSDGTVVYDYAVGEYAPQVLCNGETLAATVGSDGVVAVHDTTVTPDLAPGVPLNGRIPAPSFITRPIVVPEGSGLVLGVWRGQVSADRWIELPDDVEGLNLYVEEGSAIVLESREGDGPGAPVIRVEAGEVVAVPDGGTAVRADDGSVATLYVAGLLPEEVAGQIGGEILPGFETVGTVAVDDPADDLLRITVTTISPEADSGTWPRLSSWPSVILVTSDSLDVPTVPGVREPEEQRSIALLDLLVDEGDNDEIESDLIFSAVSGAAPAAGLLVMVEPVGTYEVLYSCYGRCIIR